MVAAFAAYLLASVVHNEAVTWIVVAVSVAAVLTWSRRRGMGRCLTGQCGPKQRQTGLSAHRPVPVPADAPAGRTGLYLRPTEEQSR